MESKKNSWIKNLLKNMFRKKDIEKDDLREKIRSGLRKNVTMIPASKSDEKISNEDDKLIRSLLRVQRGEGPIPKKNK